MYVQLWVENEGCTCQVREGVREGNDCNLRERLLNEHQNTDRESTIQRQSQ